MLHVEDAVDVTDWQRGYRACAERAVAALDGKSPCHGGFDVRREATELHRPTEPQP